MWEGIKRPKRQGKQEAATTQPPPGVVESSPLEGLPRRPQAQLGSLASYLHPVHGLPELVELVGRAEGFKADVC